MTRLDDVADRTARFLAEHTAARPAAPLIAAVSGGVDSTALALVLGRLAQRGALAGPLVLAHVDHGIHGLSAIAEERVADLARRLGAAYQVRRLASVSQRQSEADLREQRYAALADSAAAVDAGWLLTGHTADDNVETILFRMMRGTGPAGLGGIPVCRALSSTLTVLRPFLQLRRTDLEAVVTEAGETCTEDPTNADSAYARNRIRHQILPALRREAGGEIDASLLRLAAGARAVAALLAQRAAEIVAAQSRAVTPWRLELTTAPGRRDPFVTEALRQLLDRLHRHGATPWSCVERAAALLAEPAGTRAVGPGQPLVERTRSGLLLVDPGRAGSPPDDALPLPLGGGTVRFGTTEWTAAGIAHAAAPESPPIDRWHVWLDPAQAPEPWRLRTRRRGERFHPLGMAASVELTRFLSRRHVPRFDRDRLPLVVDGRDRIIWIPGTEIGDAVRLRDGTTECIELRVTAG